ncbi:MAG: LysR family transcriptional regulator [Pseudomonadales bacterium]|nr:LysR family transcriptional regulator [Pseudomonadales bacterium]
MDLDWNDAHTFLAVAEHRSFSAAARAMGLGQPTISRRIQELELRLGEQLFDRGKHGAMPTRAALRLLPAAEQMARWAAEFDRAARGVENPGGGVVRMAAPPGIAVEQLAPFAARFRTSHPEIVLDILSAVEHVDLTRGAADIAVRTQLPAEPELVALHKGSNMPGIFASEAYARTVRQPCSWHDLDWVTWSGVRRHVVPRPMLERIIPDFEPVFTSDDYLVQKAAVRAGVGAMIMGRPVLFEQTDLVEIDVGVQLPAYDFYIVVAKSVQQVPRIRLVVDELVAMMG